MFLEASGTKSGEIGAQECTRLKRGWWRRVYALPRRFSQARLSLEEIENVV